MPTEFAKCSADPCYFINKHVLVFHPAKGLIPLHLHPFQSMIIRDYQDNDRNIVLKARQLGLSTITAAYIVWLLVFSKGEMVTIVSVWPAATHTMIKKILQRIPRGFCEIAKSGLTSLVLANGSKLKVQNSFLRKIEPGSLIVIDEAAFVDLNDRVLDGHRCIAFSSPGTDPESWFCKTYQQAELGIGDFKPSVYKWFVHPDRSPSWFAQQQKKYLTKRAIAAEFNCILPK